MASLLGSIGVRGTTNQPPRNYSRHSFNVPQDYQVSCRVTFAFGVASKRLGSGGSIVVSESIFIKVTPIIALKSACKHPLKTSDRN